SLSQTAIYEKVNGKIATDKGGKRTIRNENFSLEIFNKSVPVLATPHEYISYDLSNENTREQLFGTQYVELRTDGTATIRKECSRRGFNWNENGLSRPYPHYWEPEARLWVDGTYRRANGIMADLLMLARLEKGKWDITRANTRYKLYG